MKVLIVTFFLLAGTFTHANDASHSCRGFLPKNHMWIPDFGFQILGIDEEKFNEVLDRIEAEFSADVRRRGGTLRITRRWSDGTVNAYADRMGRNWNIHMYGGLARHAAVTYDAFAMVACHELGHHIGGAPQYRGDWASNEGESDYYAALKCLRRLFLNDDNKAIVESMSVDPLARSRCRSQHGSQQDEYICIRSTMAGLALGKLLIEETNNPEPRLETPDTKIVSRMYEDHPEAQCRVDGMFHAALCRVPFSQELSDRDYRVGSCVSYDEDGARTRCWFKP